MNLEDEIFRKTRLNEGKLLSYGFTKEKNVYTYSKTILNDSFKVVVEVNKEGKVKGKVIDLSFDEEYKNYRIENATGKFVTLVRDEFTKLLNDIKDKAFDKSLFVGAQANRIAKLIFEKYHDLPDYPFSNDDISGVFRNPVNEKWYGLIMNIKKSKIDTGTDKVDVINLKLDENEIKELITRKGFYKAYHMNKEKWITLILDDTLKDEEIMKYIEESHKFTNSSDYWVIPANPKYFDIISYFNENNTITWKQFKGAKVNDIIYIYMGSPYKEIMYKCKVLETNIPSLYVDDNLTMDKQMNLMLIKKYKKEEYSLEKLKEHGITAVRGPRGLTESFKKLISKEDERKYE